MVCLQRMLLQNLNVVRSVSIFKVEIKEFFVAIYKITRLHNPQDNDRHFHRLENLKS
jgi:hypothetical protein